MPVSKICGIAETGHLLMNVTAMLAVHWDWCGWTAIYGRRRPQPCFCHFEKKRALLARRRANKCKTLIRIRAEFVGL